MEPGRGTLLLMSLFHKDGAGEQKETPETAPARRGGPDAEHRCVSSSGEAPAGTQSFFITAEAGPQRLSKRHRSSFPPPSVTREEKKSERKRKQSCLEEKSATHKCESNL